MNCFRIVAVRRMDRARPDSGASQLRRERPFASELLRAALRRWRWRCRWTLLLPAAAGTGRRSSLCRRTGSPGRVRAARPRACCPRLLDAGRRSAGDPGLRGQALPVPARAHESVRALRDIDRAARGWARASDGVGAGAARRCRSSALRPSAPSQRPTVARRPAGRRPGRARARTRRRWTVVAHTDRSVARTGSVGAGTHGRPTARSPLARA